ncbi:MAG: hypothetical protein V3W28_01680 [Thermoplasmata archaeon]
MMEEDRPWEEPPSDDTPAAPPAPVHQEAEHGNEDHETTVQEAKEAQKRAAYQEKASKLKAKAAKLNAKAQTLRANAEKLEDKARRLGLKAQEYEARA